MRSIGWFLRRYATVLVAVAVIVALSVWIDGFTNPAALRELAGEAAFVVLMGLGFTIALRVGEIDLSFGGVAALAGVCGSQIMLLGFGAWVVVPLILLIGLVAGLGNGLLVLVTRAPAVLLTFASGLVFTGLAFLASGGRALVGGLTDAFLQLGRAEPFGVPIVLLWAALAALVAHVVLRLTRPGMHLTFVGEAEDAAALVGARPRRLKFWTLTAAGFVGGAAGLILTARQGSASALMAEDHMLPAIAAALLGATTLEPGRANIPGLVVGAVLVVLAGAALGVLGVRPTVRAMAYGGLILVALLAVPGLARRASATVLGGAGR